VLVLHAVSAGFGLLAVAVYWSSLQLFLALGLLALVAAVVVGLYLASAQAYPGLSTPNGDSPGSGPEGSLTVPSTQRLGAVMRALVGSPYWKSAVGVVADVLLVAGAFVVAHHLRFEAGLPADHMTTMLQVLPAVVGVKVLVFYAFNLYHGIWRHAGTPEIVRLAAATALASVLVGAGLAFMGPEAVSVSVLVIDWMVTTAAVGGVRFGFRALRQYFAAQRDGGRRVAIYGAGSTGQLALRHLRQTPSARRTAVGFLDDSPDRQGLMLQGLTVLGTPDDLATIQDEYDLDEVVVPAADLTEAQRRRIRDRCAEVGLPCRVFSLRFRRPDEEGFDMPPVTDRGDGASRPVEESS
jgi:UDP-GlcNAc:undecaprenyl-phosphate GlcNAc-1-phosphate transferase